MSPISMSIDEAAMVQLVAAGPLETAQEVADFLDADTEERILIITARKNAQIAKTASAWDEFISVISAVEAIAGVATTIASAVTGVYAVATL